MLSPSNSEPSDSDSQLESQPGPSKKSAKKRKMKYKSKFSKEWTKTWPFIVALPGDIHSFSCTVCSTRVSCQYHGVRDVKDHISSQIHQTFAKEALSQPKLSFPSVDQSTYLEGKMQKLMYT